MSNKIKQTTNKILTAAELASANLRSDDSITFVSGGQINPVSENNAHKARIIATADGKVLVQPANNSSQIDLTQTVLSDDQMIDVDFIPEIRRILEEHRDLINERSTIKVNNVRKDIKFDYDPQEQIDKNKEVAQKNSNEALNSAKAAQKTADEKSTVSVNNIRADVNFASDPQNQINQRLTASQVTPTRIGSEIGGRVHFAGGLIIQWGYSSNQNNTFPVAFPSNCLGVFFAGFRNGGNHSAWASEMSTDNITRTGFRWLRQSTRSYINRRRWIAIGF